MGFATLFLKPVETRHNRAALFFCFKEELYEKRTSHIAHRTSHIAHRTSHFALAASALLLAGITAAHAQTLSCVGVPAGGTTTLEVKTGPGWKFFDGAAPTADVNGTGWAAARASNCTGTPACHPAWVTALSAAGLNGAQWVAPAPISGTTRDFSYASPAINVDSNVNLATLSMQVLGAADNVYLSTGVINGSPLTLNQDGATQTFPILTPGTNTFAAGAAPMTSWQHGVNYIFARTQNADPTFDFTTSPTGWLAKYTLTATCTATTPVPAVPANHPLALTLGALALAGLAGLKLRPRKA